MFVNNIFHHDCIFTLFDCGMNVRRSYLCHFRRFIFLKICTCLNYMHFLTHMYLTKREMHTLLRKISSDGIQLIKLIVLGHVSVCCIAYVLQSLDSKKYAKIRN